MAVLARARVPWLALLPAFAGAAAPVAGEAALEQASSECTTAMRVELLQDKKLLHKSHGAPAAAMLQNVAAHGAGSGSVSTLISDADALSSVDSTAAGTHSAGTLGGTLFWRSSNEDPADSPPRRPEDPNKGKALALVKSTFAISSIHTGKSLAFKRYFFPVITEQEALGVERDNFTEILERAISNGAALADAAEYYSEQFDEVAWHEACGRGARVRLSTVMGEAEDKSTQLYGSEMPHFSFHGVYSEGFGATGEGSQREVDGLKVRQVERIFQEELGSLQEYSPWMEIHTAIYDNDLDSYAAQFSSHGVPVFALRWPAADESYSEWPAGALRVRPSHFYSLIVHVPDTQEVFEIISATSPSDSSLVLREFPMARHVFKQDEVDLLRNSSGPTQLHISRTHYDLDAVKAHYEHFFNMKPVHEVRNADTGVGFVSFWHQSVYASSPGADADVLRTQVMYWNRPNQSTTVAHTTEWLERRLEQINSQYMLDYTTCWPVWGDNHYTVMQAPLNYFNSVRQKYDDAGIGYMLFRTGKFLFTAYFPLPGGMYLELQPLEDVVEAPMYARDWTDTNSFMGGSVYCYRFSCAA